MQSRNWADKRINKIGNNETGFKHELNGNIEAAFVTDNVTLVGDAITFDEVNARIIIDTAASGARGFTGSQGATGPTGPTGPEGAQGAQGTPGDRYLTVHSGAAFPPDAPAPFPAGPFTFAVETDLAYSPMQDIIIVDDSGGYPFPECIGTVVSYSKTTGLLVATDFSGSTFASPTTPLIVNLAGAAGAGPSTIGATGATGPQGIAGSPGASGLPGARGVSGPSGVSGATGSQGFTGATGPMGFTGATGPQGFTGSQGFTGATGPQGATGPSGTHGFTGATGPEGQSSLVVQIAAGLDLSKVGEAGTYFYSSGAGKNWYLDPVQIITPGTDTATIFDLINVKIAWNSAPLNNIIAKRIALVKIKRDRSDNYPGTDEIISVAAGDPTWGNAELMIAQDNFTSAEYNISPAGAVDIRTGGVHLFDRFMICISGSSGPFDDFGVPLNVSALFRKR